MRLNVLEFLEHPIELVEDNALVTVFFNMRLQ